MPGITDTPYLLRQPARFLMCGTRIGPYPHWGGYGPILTDRAYWPIPVTPIMIGTMLMIRIAPRMSKANPVRTMRVMGTAPEP
jgi:hypothetical protein